MFASQSCLSLDSSLAHPLGRAQSLAKLREVLPNQRDPATCPCGGVWRVAPSGASPKEDFFLQKRWFLFYTFPLSCLSLPLHAEVGAQEKLRSLGQWEEGSSPWMGQPFPGNEDPRMQGQAGEGKCLLLQSWKLPKCHGHCGDFAIWQLGWPLAAEGM